MKNHAPKPGVYMLGKFDVESGKLHVTDPCYGRDVWCRGVLENVKNGTWKVNVKLVDEGAWGIRNGILYAWHDSQREPHLNFKSETSNWRAEDFEVGVDSGQAGFFCDSFYPEDEVGEYGENDTFYGKCCNATLETLLGADLIDNKGVVSRSGIGDGGYVCWVARNENNEVVQVAIDFLPEEGEDY